MKKITLLLITLFATGTMLMANGGPRRGEHRNMNVKERAERIAERMTKEYSLNDTQKRQVYEANLIMMADMQPSQKQGPRGHRHPGFDKKNGPDCKCDSAQMTKRGDKDKKVARKDKADNKQANVERPSKEDREKMMKERKEKRMADMKQSRESYNTKIKSIFTKDQYEAYAKNQAERQKRMEERKASKPQPTNS